ncbi:MAG: hypothetical protein RBS37_09760 [Bacteroidales bacterium]|jgi:hypothetical protein|nr:hypothetical protein [Bacteroidales bacterium]
MGLSRAEKYNRTITGVVAGIIVPSTVMFLFYLWKSGSMTVSEFFGKLVESGVLTNTVSVAVFVNVFVFLLFNRLDMLKASRGILGVTIIWAILVFIIKFS